MTHDITERLRSQAEVREQAELLDLAHEASVVRRLDGTITYWNRGAARIYGYSREEALGRDVYALLHTAGDVEEGRRRLPEDGFWDGELTRGTCSIGHVLPDRRDQAVVISDGGRWPVSL